MLHQEYRLQQLPTSAQQNNTSIAGHDRSWRRSCCPKTCQKATIGMQTMGLVRTLLQYSVCKQFKVPDPTIALHCYNQQSHMNRCQKFRYNLNTAQNRPELWYMTSTAHAIYHRIGHAAHRMRFHHSGILERINREKNRRKFLHGTQTSGKYLVSL